MGTLEQQLQNAYASLGVSQDNQNSIHNYLSLVQKRDSPTYEHSVRCGLKGVDVAKFLHLDQKALFYAGLLHDVGKCLTDPKSLKKTEGFNEKDMAELRKHPLDSYKLLRGIHDFSAEIAIMHHKFSKNGYPKQTPKRSIDFSLNTEVMIGYFARLLSLIDFYDAASNRKNNKFSADGKAVLPTAEEVRKIMLQANPDQKILINELYAANIF